MVFNRRLRRVPAGKDRAVSEIVNFWVNDNHFYVMQWVDGAGKSEKVKAKVMVRGVIFILTSASLMTYCVAAPLAFSTCARDRLHLNMYSDFHAKKNRLS